MGVLRAKTAGLNRNFSYGVHIHLGREAPCRGIIDLKSIQQNFRLPLPGAGNMKPSIGIGHHLRDDSQALLEIVTGRDRRVQYLMLD